MTTQFDAHGPLEVPCYRGKAGRTITDDNVDAFWAANNSLARRRGCYVFGIRAGKGFTIGYVGSATRTFKQEVFAPHKLTRYQQFLADYASGTPVIFLVVSPAKKGKPNVKHVKELEQFLIQLGVAANPDLLNIKGTQAEDWGIRGVLRTGQGKPSAAAQAFKRMFKISD